MLQLTVHNSSGRGRIPNDKYRYIDLNTYVYDQKELNCLWLTFNKTGAYANGKTISCVQINIRQNCHTNSALQVVYI